MIRPTVDGNGDRMLFLFTLTGLHLQERRLSTLVLNVHIWQELITILVMYLIKRKVKCPSIRSDWILKTK